MVSFFAIYMLMGPLFFFYVCIFILQRGCITGLFKKESLVDGNSDISCNGRNGFFGVCFALRTNVFLGWCSYY